MNPLLELNKYPIPAEQVEKLVSPVCSVCGEPIARDPKSPSGWGHQSFNCELWVRMGCHNRATPASPVHTSEKEATTFALKYVHEQRLPAWVVEHIANAYSFGEMEGIKRGRAE